MSTTALLRRTLTRTTTLRPFCTSSEPTRIPTRTKTLTPLQTQFESWTTYLKPGFTPSDVNTALKSQTDHDLAYDIFRWTSQHRGYSHDETTYLTMIQLSLSSRRIRITQILIDEILAGTVPLSLHLSNSIIRHCSSHSRLNNRAFDVYKRMLLFSDQFKPDLDTFSMLFALLLLNFKTMRTSYIHLNSFKSLTKQMKLFGIIPDVHVLNLIMNAHVKCMAVDDAMRIFREMGLYGCVPDRYSYSYLIQGFCETGQVFEGLKLFRDMREKDFVAKRSVWIVLVCSLSLERMFDEAVEILRDMYGNNMGPDMLTYKTLFDEMCRDGKGKVAIELLEEFRESDYKMGDENYKVLLDNLYFTN